MGEDFVALLVATREVDVALPRPVAALRAFTERLPAERRATVELDACFGAAFRVAAAFRGVAAFRGAATLDRSAFRGAAFRGALFRGAPFRGALFRGEAPRGVGSARAALAVVAPLAAVRRAGPGLFESPFFLTAVLVADGAARRAAAAGDVCMAFGLVTRVFVAVAFVASVFLASVCPDRAFPGVVLLAGAFPG